MGLALQRTFRVSKNHSSRQTKEKIEILEYLIQRKKIKENPRNWERQQEWWPGALRTHEN